MQGFLLPQGLQILFWTLHGLYATSIYLSDGRIPEKVQCIMGRSVTPIITHFPTFIPSLPGDLDVFF